MKTEKIESLMETMIEMQDQMNTKVHPEWFTQGFAWYDAIFVECAELLDHIGWKWWKKQEPDLAQAKIELVDIFHFGISQMLVDKNGDKEAVKSILSNLCGYVYKDQPQELKMNIRKLSYNANVGHFDAQTFFVVCQALDMDLEELFVGYVSKNVLNFFRQDNGYKDGTYIKMWHGEEDNVVLDRLVKDLDTGSPTFKDDLYQALEGYYSQVKK